MISGSCDESPLSNLPNELDFIVDGGFKIFQRNQVELPRRA